MIKEKFIKKHLKKIFLLIIVVTFIFIVGCEFNNKDYVQDYYNQIIETNDIKNITDNIVLPESDKDIKVTFNSSDTNVIDSLGNITRFDEDKTVLVDIIFEFEGKITKKTIIVVVKAKEKNVNEDAEYVDRVYNSIISEIDVNNITDNLQLPAIKDGVSIEITSNKQNIISSDGIVHRTENDEKVILSFVLTYKGIQYQKELTVNVKAEIIIVLTTEEKLANIKKELVDILSLENETINQDINFINESLYDSTIIWDTSDYNVLGADGVINKNLDSDTIVTITYIIVLDGENYEYSFSLFVKAYEEIIYSSYYTDAIGKTGDLLLRTLRNIITTTHKKITTYNDCKNPYYVEQTDGDPNKPGNIILFWSGLSIDSAWDGAKSWNREHMWPQSKGWFGTSGAGADMHHIRPTDPNVNGKHGNYPYGIVNNTNYVKTAAANGSITTKCKLGGSYFEPCDERKGDTARIIFYLKTRYSESDSYAFTQVASSLNILLEWNKMDPVDNLEIRRNEAVYKIQGNRNPFIDYPEFADMIWGASRTSRSSILATTLDNLIINCNAFIN